jgi:hypothetical protein
VSVPRCIPKIFLILILLSGLWPVRFLGAEGGDTAPRSDWLESRKALYGSLLRTSGYDVLIVPFEVRGNAVDRPARSLMTRYLDDRIRRSTELKLPSATLVSRALGETARTFDEKEVYRLADDLKVKYLLRCYVGHDMDLKMDIEIQIRERQADGALSPQGSTTRIAWSGIAFSDERPPEEAFRSFLDNVMERLPFPASRKPEIGTVESADTGTIPPSLSTLASSKPATPLASAWRLQFLGLLAPEQSDAGEPFFERSLIALERVSPDVPGRALLMSRALFYLHRRPAAVAALPNPSTPEEKAFAAFLDADLPETTKRTEEVRLPIPRLLARIEENDLRWEFDRNLPQQEKYEDFAGELPDWKTLLLIRLRNKDYWDAPSNILVKRRMDKEFPVPGYTSESLATGRVMLGESPLEGEEIEISVSRHCRKVLESRAREYGGADDAASPVERDALDLYAAFGESNVAKLVRLRAQIQHLPEEALRVLDRVDGVYRGHPILTWFRAWTLREQGKERNEESRASLLRTARELAAGAFIWSGGQTMTARWCVDLLSGIAGEEARLSSYNGDFPGRHYWKFSESGDRRILRKEALSTKNGSGLAAWTYPDLRNRELAILYAHTNFRSFSNYYDWLVYKRNEAAADAFLAANKRRYTGSPWRVSFLAGIARKKGDEAGAAGIYKEAIADIPEVWEPYEEYGSSLILQGEIDNAARLFRSYPLFLADKNVTRDAVALSNYAYNAGEKFWLLGETETAVPFFRIAADYKTGSGAGMAAAARIALAEQDYRKAAYHFLEGAKRYSGAGFIRFYISSLHMMGLGKQAWPVFDSIVGKNNEAPVWSAPFVGFRIDGAGDNDVAQWFARDPIRKAAGSAIGDYLLPVYLVDRPPDPALAAKIRDAETAGGGAAAAAPSAGNSDPERSSDLYEFYVRVRGEDWSGAVSLLRNWMQIFTKPGKHRSYVMFPYMAWLSAKSGAGSLTFHGFLDNRKELNPFGYRLAKAMLFALKGEDETAVRYLKEAYWEIPRSYEKKPLIDPWYQLVETCEWIYGHGKRPVYKELAVDWARKHQRIRPMYGWAYAVEAKYTDNPADRLRALGLALYLDRRSERIAAIPENEKAKAREWLEKNNPFKIHKPAPAGV